ncbi:hypothetical protein RKD24_002294 [Streptomyces calvus]
MPAHDENPAGDENPAHDENPAGDKNPALGKIPAGDENPAYDGTAYDDAERDGTAYAAERDGMDALMSALFDEPPPADAQRDPAFLAARDAAAADLAVLREQLTLIGDALATPPGTKDTAPGRLRAAHPGGRPEPGTGTRQTALPHPRHPATADDGPGPSPAAGLPLSAPPSRPTAGSHGSHGSRGSREAHGPGPRRARRRPVKVALGALVAAAAATLVVGTGWLVTQSGGTSDAAADKAAVADSGAEGGVLFGSPRYLACARLVAEGTVLAVEPVPGSAGTERVTFEASRVYKSEGEDDGAGDREIVFLRETAGGPPLHPGDGVLVGLPRHGDRPDTLIAGEQHIAPERTRIADSLPRSRGLSCD